jgi:hypothetical protein
VRLKPAPNSVGLGDCGVSDPEAECEETLMKAAALHRVLETGVCATGLADSAVASA